MQEPTGTDQLGTHSSAQSNGAPIPPAQKSGEILACCKQTVDSLAHINGMMVCGDCKQIIKVFREERPYRNYLKFCQGRSRIIMTSQYNEYYVVAYHSYDA